MSKRKPIETSLDAYHSLDPNGIRAMYRKIGDCLRERGNMTYEELADALNEKPERVWKRMSECLKIGIAHRTGERKVMKSGRQGFVWSYGPEPTATKKPEKTPPGPAVVDYSRALIQPNISKGVQNKLF